MTDKRARREKFLQEHPTHPTHPTRPSESMVRAKALMEEERVRKLATFKLLRAEGKTFQEIADITGTTRQAVSQFLKWYE